MLIAKKHFWLSGIWDVIIIGSPVMTFTAKPKKDFKADKKPTFTVKPKKDFKAER